MKMVTTHVVNAVNDRIDIEIMDDHGPGGAHHDYMVTVHGKDLDYPTLIAFQNGPIAEAGVNGLTHEVLLAIVKHRLEHFQKGPYACAENALALADVTHALETLKARTRARMARGVEGTMNK